MSLGTLMLLFRTGFNPIDYDGSAWQEVKNNYRTNEIGFFITLTFFGVLGWSLLEYRKNKLLYLKKRFVF